MSPVSQPATDIKLSAEATLNNPTERPALVVTNDVRMRIEALPISATPGLSRRPSRPREAKARFLCSVPRKTVSSRSLGVFDADQSIHHHVLVAALDLDALERLGFDVASRPDGTGLRTSRCRSRAPWSCPRGATRGSPRRRSPCTPCARRGRCCRPRPGPSAGRCRS